MLGEVLVALGLVSEEQVDEALDSPGAARATGSARCSSTAA